MYLTVRLWHRRVFRQGDDGATQARAGANGRTTIDLPQAAKGASMISCRDVTTLLYGPRARGPALAPAHRCDTRRPGPPVRTPALAREIGRHVDELPSPVRQAMAEDNLQRLREVARQPRSGRRPLTARNERRLRMPLERACEDAVPASGVRAKPCCSIPTLLRHARPCKVRPSSRPSPSTVTPVSLFRHFQPPGSKMKGGQGDTEGQSGTQNGDPG
jgi:hypothetical protein